MAWLRRSRFRNRDHKHSSVVSPKNPNLSSSHTNKDPTTTTTTRTSTTTSTYHYPYKPRPNPTNQHTTVPSNGKTDKLLPKDKHHRRFFSLFRRKHTTSASSSSTRPHTSPTTTTNHHNPSFYDTSDSSSPKSPPPPPRDDLTYDGTLDTMDMSYGISTTTSESNSNTLYLLPMNPPAMSMDDDVDDEPDYPSNPNTTDRLFRRQPPTSHNLPSYPSIIAPRQSSDVSQLSSISRRGSDSSAWSGSTLRDDSAQSLVSTRPTAAAAAGGGAGTEDSGSVSSTSIQSTSDPMIIEGGLPPITRRFSRLRNNNPLDVIPDTSFHSTLSGSRPSSRHGGNNGSLHGSSRHSGTSGGNGNGGPWTKERMERTLLQRTAMMEDEDDDEGGGGSGGGETTTTSSSLEVVNKPMSPKPRSFLDPVVPEPMTFGSNLQSHNNGGGTTNAVAPSTLATTTTTTKTTASASSSAWDVGMEGILPSLIPPQTIHRSVTPTDSLVLDSLSHSSSSEPTQHPVESSATAITTTTTTTRSENIHLIPLVLDRDLSEDPEVDDDDDDEEDSRYHLPTDLSMDVESESIVLVPSSSEEASTAALPPPPPPPLPTPGQDPQERKTLERMDLSHSQSPHPTTALSNNEHFPSRRNIDPFRFSTSGSPKTAPTPSTPSSQGSSSREDVGRTIRASILSTQMFDSDCEPCTMSSSSASESNSFSRGSGSVSSPRMYAQLQHDEKSSSSSSNGTNSYHFCNMPMDLLSDTASKQRMEEDEEDSDSEGANAASSDEDINALEELYVDIFGNDVDELEKDALMQPAHADGGMEEDVNNGVQSMLGLFKDDKSCQSSVVSFDSTEFMEDDPYDDLNIRTKTSCSISMHDITTIHEEDEDDIAEEEPEVQHVSRMIGGKLHQFPAPLVNGELHLHRLELKSQGTTGTFSSVTDDSYLGCMSFDSLSSFSDIGNSPIYGHQRKAWAGVKVDMSHHNDFVAVPNMNPNPNPNAPNALHDESSQLTYESSKASFADSACSYDSFSSESVKYMVDILKEEAERRRSKIKERIAKIRESTNRASHTSEYMASSLASISDKMDD